MNPRATHALANARPPWPASEEPLEAQGELLRGLIAEAGAHGSGEADERIYRQLLRVPSSS